MHRCRTRGLSGPRSVPGPVAAGLAASYARPGGNVTGVTSTPSELDGKRLQLLKQVVPAISRVAVLWSSTNPFPADTWARDGQALGVSIEPMVLHGPDEIDG